MMLRPDQIATTVFMFGVGVYFLASGSVIVGLVVILGIVFAAVWTNRSHRNE